MALITVLCPKIFWKNLQRNCKTLEAIQKTVDPRVILGNTMTNKQTVFADVYFIQTGIKM